MSSAVAAGASSSCSAAFSRNISIKATSSTPSSSSSTPKLTLAPLKTKFQGVSLEDAKRGASTSFLADYKYGGFKNMNVRRGRLEINARTAGTSKQIEVEVDKPLGLTLGPKPGSGGGVVITGVEGGGNAAKSGLKVGDQVIYTSSFFGDELWPADRLGFTKTAIQAKPDSVYFVVSRFPYFLLQTTTPL